MKPAIIAAVVLALAVYLAPGCEAKHSSPDITETSNNQSPCRVSASFLFIQDQEEWAASDNHSAHDDPPNWRNPPEWVLPLIGFITALIVIWQSWETRKAAQAAQKSAGTMEGQTGILEKALSHAEKSANAAEISAQTAMGTAIPRLMLFSFDFAPMGAASFSARIQYPKVKIMVKNYGQTPAFLKSYGVEFTCEPLPEEPLYRHTKPIPPEQVVEPGNTLGIPFGDIYIAPQEFLSDSDIKAVMNSGKGLVVYGFVRYGNFFGSPDRELRFCKRLDFDPTTAPDPFWWEWEEYGNQKYSNQQNPN